MTEYVEQTQQAAAHTTVRALASFAMVELSLVSKAYEMFLSVAGCVFANGTSENMARFTGGMSCLSKILDKDPRRHSEASGQSGDSDSGFLFAGVQAGNAQP